MVTDIDKRKLKKIVRNKQAIRRRVWKLKENNIKTRFQERVKELVDVDAPNLLHTFKNSMLQTCDEVCGKKKGKRNNRDTWWWNEKVEKAIQQKKVAHKKMCKNRLEENKARQKNIKNRTKKLVANSMRKEAEKELTKLNKKPNNIVTLVKFIKKDGKDIEEGRCMRGKDGRLGYSEKDKKRIWKNLVEEIMNKKNNWDHVTAASIVEGPI